MLGGGLSGNIVFTDPAIVGSFDPRVAHIRYRGQDDVAVLSGTINLLDGMNTPLVINADDNTSYQGYLEIGSDILGNVTNVVKRGGGRVVFSGAHSTFAGGMLLESPDSQYINQAWIKGGGTPMGLGPVVLNDRTRLVFSTGSDPAHPTFTAHAHDYDNPAQNNDLQVVGAAEVQVTYTPGGTARMDTLWRQQPGTVLTVLGSTGAGVFDPNNTLAFNTTYLGSGGGDVLFKVDANLRLGLLAKDGGTYRIFNAKGTDPWSESGAGVLWFDTAQRQNPDGSVVLSDWTGVEVNVSNGQTVGVVAPPAGGNPLASPLGGALLTLGDGAVFALTSDAANSMPVLTKNADGTNGLTALGNLTLRHVGDFTDTLGADGYKLNMGTPASGALTLTGDVPNRHIGPGQRNRRPQRRPDEEGRRHVRDRRQHAERHHRRRDRRRRLYAWRRARTGQDQWPGSHPGHECHDQPEQHPAPGRGAAVRRPNPQHQRQRRHAGPEGWRGPAVHEPA